MPCATTYCTSEWYSSCGESAHAGLLHHGVGHGVGIVLLQAGRQPEHLRLVPAAEGHHRRHLRRRVGQRTRLVEDHRVRRGHRLEEAPAAHGDVPAAALPHGREHRNGHRQLQRAGEVHHQHRQRLLDIAGQQVDQRRAAQRIGHQAIRQPRRPILCRGFQLLRLLNHMDDAVITAAARGLVHADDALARLHDRPGVDIAAHALVHRHCLAGHGGLVDHALALGHAAVQRNHPAGADHDAVAGPDIFHWHQHIRLAGTHPDLIDVQGHGVRQVGHGLLVRPLLQNLAQAEHEHHRARGVEVAAQHGDRHRRGIQHRDRELPMAKRPEPLADIMDGPEHGDGRRHRRGQEQLRRRPAQDRENQLVLELPVQLPGRVLRHQTVRLRARKGKARQRAHQRLAAAPVDNRRVAGAVVDRHALHAVQRLQLVLQQIGLMERHVWAGQPHAHPPRNIVQNFAFHTSLFSYLSLIAYDKQSRPERAALTLF